MPLTPYGEFHGRRHPSATELQMPPIDPRLLDSVFFVYDSMQDARQNIEIGASGFLVSVPLAMNQECGQAYAVTNKHVIESCPKKSVVLRLNNSSGEASTISVRKEQWHLHPMTDVAITDIDFAIRDYRYTTIPTELFATKERIEAERITHGDDVFMIGRFVAHAGKRKNLPSIRFGNISMMPSEPIRVGRQILPEAYLVESRSIGGYSGSPVFVWILPGCNRQPLEFGVTYYSHMRGPWLLGIDCGHIETTEQIRNKDGTKSIGTVTFNSAMAATVPVWSLFDLFNEQSLVESRTREDERITKEKAMGKWKQD